MSDLQILIENIRTALSFSETIPPDQLRLYARDYAESCTELNRRMQQCVPHIRKGNVAEAVRLAEMPPNLPELYTLLDFPERDEWTSVVSTLGFDVPPPLSAEQAKELNATYLKFSPLEPLFRMYRIHTLNGSPIRDRLAVLRAIALSDVENTFWHEDLETFEAARVAELDREVRAALKAKKNGIANIEEIRTLLDELNSTDWIVPPSRDHVRRLMLPVMQNYSEELQRHFSAFDYPKAAAVYQTMQQTLAANKMPMPPLIEHEIRPAVHWMNQAYQQNLYREDFVRCETALKNALGDGSSASVLDRLHYTLTAAAAQAGAVVSTELEELYQSRIEAHESRRSRQNKRLVFSVICFSLLVGGLLAWGLGRKIHSEKVSDTLASLQILETEKRFDEIDGTIQRVENDLPSVAKTPAVAAVIEKLRSMKKNDDVRAEDFSRYVVQALAGLDARPRPDLNELELIRVSVDQAEKLQYSPREKSQYIELKRKFDAAVLARKREVDADFAGQLTAVSDELNAIGRDSTLSTGEALNKTKELTRKMEPLSRRDRISQDVKAQAAIIQDKIEGFQKNLEKREIQEKTLANLLDFIGDWDRYKASLDDFVAQHQDHPVSTDAAEVSRGWEPLKSLATLIEKFCDDYRKSTDGFSSLQKNSPALWTQLKDIRDRFSDGPDFVFPPSQELERLSQTDSYSSRTLKSTDAILKSLSQKEVWPWIDEESKRWYYLTKRPTSIGDYMYVTSFSSDEKRKTIKSGSLSDDAFLETQYQLAQTAMKRIDGIKENCSEVVCGIMESTLDSDGIDPILKCVLLESLILDASKADPIFAETFAASLKILQGSRVEATTNWMDVNSKDTVSQRNLATTALSRLPNVKLLSENMKRDAVAFRNTLLRQKPRFEWIGVLLRRNNEWNCVLSVNFAHSQSGELCIFRQNSNGKFHPINIGSSTDKGIELSGSDQQYMQCLPVFFKQY